MRVCATRACVGVCVWVYLCGLVLGRCRACSVLQSPNLAERTNTAKRKLWNRWKALGTAGSGACLTPVRSCECAPFLPVDGRCLARGQRGQMARTRHREGVKFSCGAGSKLLLSSPAETAELPPPRLACAARLIPVLASSHALASHVPPGLEPRPWPTRGRILPEIACHLPHCSVKRSRAVAVRRSTVTLQQGGVTTKFLVQENGSESGKFVLGVCLGLICHEAAMGYYRREVLFWVALAFGVGTHWGDCLLCVTAGAMLFG